MVRSSFAASLLSLPVLVQALGKTRPPASVFVKQTKTPDGVSTADATPSYPAYNISTPIDHFHNDSLYEPHSDGFYNMRYWFDAQYYEEGGPVIVLAAGETSGEDRFPYLQKGILAQLAQATGGIGVILEHRYYGESWPVDDLSTESLRFLTTDQALADTAYFAQNVQFPGLEDKDLTSNTTAYIAYGGSYAGAFVAFLRKLYPDVYFGAIASSGVTEAIYDYWQYYEGARIYGPPACVEATQKVTNVVDNILIGKNGSDYVQKLKTVFGLPNVTLDADFANTLTGGISALQNYNWDPTQSSDFFFLYCDVVGNDSVLYPHTESLRPAVEELISVGGWANETDSLSNHFLNYIGWVNLTAVITCKGDQNTCFAYNDPQLFAKDDITQTWRSWPYQFCTQWGYLASGSGVPDDILPVISRTIDLPYLGEICVDAFNITTPADVDAINKYGGFNISYPRLAIIDGQWDPWRDATPHAHGLPERPNTTDEPFVLISGGVHHWDENGLFPNETTATLPPEPVKKTQAYEAVFVQDWLKEWKTEKSAADAKARGAFHRLYKQY